VIRARNPPCMIRSVSVVAEIEKEWTKIRAELDEVLKRRDELPAFHELTKEVSTITTDQMWKTFLFYGFGVKSEVNLRACRRQPTAPKNPGCPRRFSRSFRRRSTSGAPGSV